ncbi:MAG: sigma 54-interacting transcriptional regulator [Pyrinomonadaceae bacterium]
MKADHFEIITRVATTFASGGTLRESCGQAILHISQDLPSRFVFVARRSVDSGIADMIAACGLQAADFRRLETRLSKSSLWQILQLSKPLVIDDLANDLVLNFLGFATGTGMLVATPIVIESSVVGFLAAGFERDSVTDENRIVRLLLPISAMIAQTIRVEQTLVDESRRIAEENSKLQNEVKQKYDFRKLIGNSSPMRQVFDRVRQIARSNNAVLLRGQSGTGKEMIATSIHYNSLRSKRKFVKVNCASAPSGVIDSELFGGGSTDRKKNSFATADGGTIFIDEIGELSKQTQSRLRDVLNDPNTNVRLIAATRKDLETMVATDEFIAELFQKLNSFTIFLPPLSERKSDILLLAEHFLEKYAAEHKKNILRISTPAIDMLVAYHFPGNVRELENVIEHAVNECDSNVVHGHHLPPTLQTAEVTGTETRLTLDSAVAAFERDLIQDALKSTRGNVAKAARMLDSTERILGYKIKNYSLDPQRFKRWR